MEIIQHFFYQLWEGICNTSGWEWTASLFGVISVLFSYRNSMLLYPAGIISTGIYCWLLSQSEHALYAEALLNFYYLVMSVYGWWHWKSEQVPVKISSAGKADLGITTILIPILWITFYLLLLHTNSNVPAIDSFVSATACAGMWLLAKRKIENWLVLNVSNFVSIPLFCYKGLYVTMLLTLFLFIVAVLGYFNWKKLLKAEQE